MNSGIIALEFRGLEEYLGRLESFIAHHKGVAVWELVLFFAKGRILNEMLNF